jgi:hypothetical protein
MNVNNTPTASQQNKKKYLSLNSFYLSPESLTLVINRYFRIYPRFFVKI